MLKALGRYVELASKDDEATFISSGFVPKATARASAAQPLPQPTIAKIEQGNSGQLSVSATPVHQKALFEMRYAPAVPGGTPSNWIYVKFTSTRPPQLISGLTPGTEYVFQVCAHGKAGQTDFSDPVTRMCI
jgi:Fibronectin type III domain